jgi:rhamnulose-1-phosphate aldolase
MKVVQSELLKSFTRMAMDGFLQGWHERNGGNLTYRMKAEEVQELSEDFREDGAWEEFGWQSGHEADSAFPDLAGEYFMVTGSGKYFRNMQPDPENNIAVIKLNEDGTRFMKVWGLVSGGRPTSELPTHLANLQVVKARDKEMRLVYHCHPVNLLALTYVLPLDGRVFTRELYEMATECPIVFPEGIGIVPWMLCGGKAIGDATSDIMKKQDFALWAHHGAFCCGHDFDETFGLMHTVEKAAEVLVKVMSMSSVKRNTISPDNFRELNAPFGVKINETFLYDKKDGTIGQLPE